MTSVSVVSISDLLARASAAPAALLLSGEAGMGKTTQWQAGIARAREGGFDVLSTRAAVGESTLAHASLADLLARVDSRIWADLPPPQRRALDVILLRDNSCGAQPELRTAATAVLSVVQRLAETSPVLLAIDDLQWVDPESADILSFVTRRLSGPVGVLTTVLEDAGSPLATAELELARVSDVDRVTLTPMTLGCLHAMLSRRLGRSLPRPALVRIHEISGGNPYYALELALAVDDTAASGHGVLPGTLIDVVRSRVGSLGEDVQHALLAAAAMNDPTVELVAHVLAAAPDDVLGLLETAEEAGLLQIDGHRFRFAHPLLARGIYSSASPARRRRLHRSLAEGVVDPELRARHLALGSAAADPRVVRLLDSAAESARRRGAQATAAELLDLAGGLGGDTPARRIHTAACHFAAGNVRHARVVLEQSMAKLPPGLDRARALGMLAGVHMFDDSFTTAAELLREGLTESAERSASRVQMLIAQAFAQLNVDDVGAAVHSAERAVTEATELGAAGALSQALGMRLVLAMLQGDGLDEATMLRALRSDDPALDTPMPFRAEMNHALLQAWNGQLEVAHTILTRLGRSCRERGDEHEQLYVGFHTASIAVWRGDFPAATELALEVTERAEQLGGDIPLAMAATTQATLDAHAGRVEAARASGHAALEFARRSGANALSRSALASLAFLESSLGHHQAAAKLLTPLLDADAKRPRATELATGSYLPDAIEALISLGRCDEAELLVDRLERNGRRLDRPWMLAIGGRCRALLDAALGNLEAANDAIEAAMVHHDRLPMPFERARSQLVLGQLQRRQRRKDEARATFTTALAGFDALNTPLWSDRARLELARANSGPHIGGTLTPTERAVAELTAAGMTNRDVAAGLFISPKTVEANLTRVYRKLNIHSRAQLGRYMGQFDEVGA